MFDDICHVCMKPITEGQARYGASAKPCHWDCRGSAGERKEHAAIDAVDAIDKMDKALAKLKRNLS